MAAMDWLTGGLRNLLADMFIVHFKKRKFLQLINTNSASAMIPPPEKRRSDIPTLYLPAEQLTHRGTTSSSSYNTSHNN